MRCDELPLNVFREVEYLEKQKEGKKKSSRKAAGKENISKLTTGDLVEDQVGQAEKSDEDLKINIVTYPDDGNFLTPELASADDILEDVDFDSPPIEIAVDGMEDIGRGSR